MPEPADQTKQAIQTLQADFPNLVVTAITYVGKGWNNIAYLVNNSLVFRLPSARQSDKPARIAKVKSEVAILNKIYGKLDIATPRPTHIAPDYSYFGYPHLPGDPLQDHPAAYHSGSQKIAFTELLATAAAAVAKLVPVNEAKMMGIVPFTETSMQLANIEYAVQHKLLSPTGIRLAQWCLSTYQTTYDKAMQRAIVVHGDPGPSNMLVDASGTITALIDWTETCIAPIERDLAYFPWEKIVSWPKEAADCYAKAFGYQPDLMLVYLIFLAGNISDIGELAQKGAPLDRPDVQHHIQTAEFWADELAATYL